MSTRSGDADSREHSPDHEASPAGKRTSKKRKVLSCYACRDRKMKCDRVYPVCSRCQKTGRADQCTYDPRLLEDLTGNNGVQADDRRVTLPEHNTHEYAYGSSSSEMMRSHIKLQDRKIEELERKLAAKESSNSKEPSSLRHFTPAGPADKEEIMFRGKGFKTQFHGPTSAMSVIAQYSELQAFTREALTVDHSIMRVKTDFKTFRDRRKVAAKQNDGRILGIDAEVFAALPDRNAIDMQVALYFDTWESTYRIMHEPSFWREYSAFWEQRSGESSQPSFAVMLLLMLACVKCVTPKDDVFEGDTTVDRQAASNIIDLCDAWIGRQPRKRLTLQFFQIRILSLLAKRANCVKLKQDWVASGDLVRLALAAGMHRDPSLLSTGSISPFETEMKKRLWVTIMELELQSSLESGLQSSLAGLYWDTPAPANLPDDAFSIDTQEMPASRPLDYFTSASYLCISRQSIPYRLRLMQVLNDPSKRLEHLDMLEYDSELNTLVRELPKWDDPRATIPSALLRLQVHQFRLILNSPFAKLAPSNDQYAYPFMTCCGIAESIIKTHNDLLSKGILALNNMRNDVLRVALILSRVLYLNFPHSRPVKSSMPALTIRQTHFADPQNHIADLPPAKHLAQGTEVSLALLPEEPFYLRTLGPAAIDCLDLAAQTFEQKVMRLGTGYMEYWLLSAAIGMLPSSSSSKPPATSLAHITTHNDDIQARCRKTLDRFQGLAFRVLALQKDPANSFASSLRSTMASVSPSDVRTPRSVGAGGVSGYGEADQARLASTYPAIPGMMSSAGMEPMAKDMSGTFDTLQDMQVDLTGWNFPDFWAFDLGGDF